MRQARRAVIGCTADHSFNSRAGAQSAASVGSAPGRVKNPRLLSEPDVTETHSTLSWRRTASAAANRNAVTRRRDGARIPHQTPNSCVQNS